MPSKNWRKQVTTEELLRKIEEQLESDRVKNMLNLSMTPLLEKEADYLRKDETNWQSFVLSSLVASGIVKGGHLFYHWYVNGLEKTPEIYECFCKVKEWKARIKNECAKKECWMKEKTEFDSVLKDEDGKWLGIFEFEDSYDLCCQEISSMLKILRWLRNQKDQKSKGPLLYLFYWLPLKPKKEFEISLAKLKKIKDFVNKYFYEDLRGTRFTFVLQAGRNSPPCSIAKTVIVSDAKDFRDLEMMVRKEFTAE